ncbi:BgTH12-03135 [Blumeria graminis f. sp. triticale]|uniref:BgtA-20218 n=3 Tax=Blumeria graminis TaxID=34373 RepID=A0A9X9MIX8_BLUGR|nr:hypothetical protein BGT96224_A20218 [Blumeria graminis f. sp. tritici 96224]CAD6503471.1 BgTH12-03135 [Blumeria graminis f. sp. triticale]VDB89563.1 BgtA-20218 [Blumeria graminis f. sp. tritici]
MPPKPFNPPRPSNSVASTPVRVGDSGKERASRINKLTPASGSSRSQKMKASSSKGIKKKPRISAASLARLPSLSPGTSDDGDSGPDLNPEEELGEEEGDDIFNEVIETSTRSRIHDSSRSTRTRVTSYNDATSAEKDRTEVVIPSDLTSVLLNEMFKKGSCGKDSTSEGADRAENTRETRRTRLTKQAVGAVAKYLDIFVREAVARAAWEGIERGGNGVLEVEDLERLAPQLLLDF